MSLTQKLKDKTSPVSLFIRDNFPTANAILKPVRKKLKELTNSSMILPKHKSHSLIGTAMDYRIRFYLTKAKPNQVIEILDRSKKPFQDAETKFFDYSIRQVKFESEYLIINLSGANNLVISAPNRLGKLDLKNYKPYVLKILLSFAEYLQIHDTTILSSKDKESIFLQYIIAISYLEQLLRSGRIADNLTIAIHNSRLPQVPSEFMDELLSITDPEVLEDFKLHEDDW